MKNILYASILCILQSWLPTVFHSQPLATQRDVGSAAAEQGALTQAESSLLDLRFSNLQAQTTTVRQRIATGVKNGKTAFLIVFWATWCGPCMKKMPSLQRLLRSQEFSNLDIIPISLDQFNIGTLEKYGEVLLNNKETIYHADDSEQMQSVMRELSFKSIPAFILISATGEKLIDSHYWTNVTDWTDSGTMKRLKQLIDPVAAQQNTVEKTSGKQA